MPVNKVEKIWMNGQLVNWDDAKAYCAWLKKTTGRPFRLGTVKEMTPIYEADETPENTLDFWAGYALNPEDRRKLESEIKNLGGIGDAL